MITVIQHNKNCWMNMARAAFRAGRNDIGNRYANAARLPVGRMIDLQVYDELQSGFIEWLNWNRFPVKNI